MDAGGDDDDDGEVDGTVDGGADGEPDEVADAETDAEADVAGEATVEAVAGEKVDGTVEVTGPLQPKTTRATVMPAASSWPNGRRPATG